MENKTSSKKYIWVVLGVIVVILVLGFLTSQALHLDDTESAIEMVRQYGPFVAIPIIILEVIIAPIPGGVFPIVLGAVYGSALGALYAWIGNVIGSLIAFLLVRKFGRRIFSKMMPNIKMDAFEQFVQKRTITVWLMYAIPIFPIDLMSFAMGLSNISFKKFATIITIAFIPHLFLLTYLGDVFIDSNVINRIVIGLIVLVILIIGYIIERKINEKNNVIASSK